MGQVTHFFKVSIQDVKAKKYKGWSKAELLVWMVLKAHSDYHTHEAWPSYSTIQDLTGLGRSSIAGALAGLERRGIITCDSGHSTRTHNYYGILEDYDD